MKKSQYIILGFLILIVTLAILQETLKSKPISWYPSYADFDDRPLGSEIFYDLLSSTEVVKNKKNISQNPYLFFEKNEDGYGDIIFFNSYVNFTDAEIKSALKWVEKGNNILIASKGFPEILRDTLGIYNTAKYSYDNVNFEATEYDINWYHDNKDERLNYRLWKELNYLYFDSIQPNTEVISQIKSLRDSTDQKLTFPNAVKADFGEGSFYLVSTPAIFSNYFLVNDDNYQYTFELLEFLDLSHTFYVDKYHKNFKNEISSPLYYLLTNKYLKAGYYFLIFTLIVFVIFEGKRKQKPISVIEPLKNKSLEFASTIAGLYYKEKDHLSIANKRIKHLYLYINKRYHMNTNQIDEEFIEELARKSNTKISQVKHLFMLIKKIDKEQNVQPEKLEELDRFIKILKQ